MRRFLHQARTKISPSATMNKRRGQGTPKLGSTGIHATALKVVSSQTSRVVLTYVLFSLLPWCFLQRICDSVWTRHFMGQLGLPPQPEIALPLIHQAATVDSVQVPQPAYIFTGNSPTRHFPRNSCAAYCAAPVGPARGVSSFRACCIPPLRPCAVHPWTCVRVGDALFGVQYHPLANQ